MGERRIPIQLGEDPRPKRLDAVLAELERRYPHPRQWEQLEEEKTLAILLHFADAE